MPDGRTPSLAQERRFRAPADSPVWNIAVALRIAGQLDPEVLRRCLAEIVRRHEVLRSALHVADERAVMVVDDAPVIELPVLDLAAAPAPAAHAGDEAAGWDAVQRVRHAEAAAPLAFPSGPVFRFRLIRIDAQSHALLLTFHHSAVDGRRSVAIAMRELAALYEAFARGHASPLPALPLQYHDYAAWQRERYGGAAAEAAIARWRARLDGAPRGLALPTDRPRPPARSFRGAVITSALSRADTTALRELSRRERVTLFMTALAAWTLVLHRATAARRLVVGTTIATRNRPGTRELIGNFVNFLPVVADLSGDPDIRTVLDRVRRAALDTFEDPELPFELLTAALDPDAEPARPPLCQVVFAWHGPLPAPQQGGGLTLALDGAETHTGTCKFDLHVHAAEVDDELRFEVEYATDLFDAARVARLVRDYEAVLATLGARLEQPLSAVAASLDGDQP
jgi:hypothetical protein